MKRFLGFLVSLPVLLGLVAWGAPSPLPRPFNLEGLLIEVFDPQPGDKVLVMVDLPHGQLSDSEAWVDRREMAKEWHAALQGLAAGRGFVAYPVLTYPATGAHNSPLPEFGEMDGRRVRLEDVLAEVSVALAFTEYSATAPLFQFTEKRPGLRAASMPGVTAAMQQTALAADYGEVARKAHVLAARLDRAVGAEIEFSTGHRLYVDLRNRQAEVDDGKLHAGKEGARVINLPSGEAYIAPYEGEVDGQPSRTEGMIPLLLNDALVVVRVEGNRVVEVLGDGAASAELETFFATDRARRNIAELGLGCNDKAVVTGNVLEDEKVVGVHLACGRSDHIGGIVGVDDFQDPAYVVHQDAVFPLGGPVEIASLALEYEDGTREEIIRDGGYTIFGWSIRVEHLFLAWVFLVAGSLNVLASDMARGTPVVGGVKLLWVLATLICGPLASLAHPLLYRQRVRKRSEQKHAIAGKTT